MGIGLIVEVFAGGIEFVHERIIDEDNKIGFVENK
jgi:hypothetical protein